MTRLVHLNRCTAQVASDDVTPADFTDRAPKRQKLTWLDRAARVRTERDRAVSLTREHLFGATRASVRQYGPVAMIDHVEGQCRWPIGEPKGAETVYCGQRTVRESSYCAYHNCVVHGRGTALEAAE